MSNVTVLTGDAIRESDSLRPVVEQATTWLEHILSESPEPITVEWGLIRQMRTGDVFVELHLRGDEPNTRSSGLFTPPELQDRDFVESSFRALFLEMMRHRTHKILRGLRDPDRIRHELAHAAQIQHRED